MSFHLVKEFNTTFEVVIRDTGAVRVPEAKLRFGLIKEELGELLEAYEACDIVELADAFGDIEYVTIGAAQAFGIADEVEDRYYEILSDEELDDHDTNAIILSEKGHTLILNDLREAILYNDIDFVVEILASLLAINTAAAQNFQIELPSIVDAIHTSNMTKLGPNGEVIRRPEDNKVLKGPNYKTPTDDINKILFGDHYAPTGD